MHRRAGVCQACTPGRGRPSCGGRRTSRGRREMAEAATAYKQLEDAIVASRLRWNPGQATPLGRHEYDAELGDRSAGAFDARTHELSEQIRGLEATEAARLPEPYRARHGILLRKLRYERDDEAVYADSRHSPGAGLAMLGGACLPLVIREFAPL